MTATPNHALQRTAPRVTLALPPPFPHHTASAPRSAVAELGVVRRFSTYPMNDAIEAPQQSVFTPLVQSGPLQLFLGLLLVAIGIFHLSLSLRTLFGRRVPMEAAFHAILLFSGPCITLLLVFALLPTEVPGLFIVGIDAGEGLKHTLELTSFFGWLCLSTFIPNLFLTMISLNRSQRIAS